MRQDREVIERYTLPEMGRVWSEAHKYELWCRIETLVLEAHARAGTVPADSVPPVRAADLRCNPQENHLGTRRRWRARRHLR